MSWLQPAGKWSPPTTYGNKRKYIDCIQLERPDSDANGVNLPLIHARDTTPVDYSFGGLMYAIRCMVRENEDLNVDESPDYHVVLDWNLPRNSLQGTLRDGRFIGNVHAIWSRSRELLAKFILGAECFIAFECGNQSIDFSE